MTEPGRRLAIIGGGPRAAYALECLARRRADGRSVPARIDVYEPHRELGTGSAYEADQPDWIRLNLPDHVVPAGVTGSGPATAGPGLSGGDNYPPRSQAGRNLAELARRSIESLRPALVHHVPHEVTAVTRDGSIFKVTHDGEIAEHDAVLLATGHARSWKGQLSTGESSMIPALPVHRLIDRAGRLSPARVCIRGAALTAIDAALALSEGLGGRFIPNRRSPSGLSFRPGDLNPHLTMVSRSGRFMAIKTESRVLRRYRSAEVAAPIISAFGAEPDDHDIGVLLRTVAAVVLDHAFRAWPGLTGAEDSHAQVRLAWCGLETPGENMDVRVQLERSLGQARGERAPDGLWALGQAWRCAYPALVRRQRQLAGQELRAPMGWDDYSRLAPELERLAFGPPPVNGAKLLALMEADRLSVSTSSAAAFAAFTVGYDLVVDAVTAPPGIRGIVEPLWQQLLDDGLVAAAPYGRGILVDEAAGCLDHVGVAVPGLSAVGRVTEDVVIGNDTLTRTLHDDLERWADRLCTSRELVS